MNKEIKQKWLEALRSGKYNQGKGYLHRADNNTYCCLGVLVDVVRQDYKEEVSVCSLSDQGCNPLIFKSELTDKEIKMMTIGTYEAMMSRKDLKEPYTSLAELNDNGVFTFEDIANIIERLL